MTQLAMTAESFHVNRVTEAAREILDGLRQSQKTLPCKYFYDKRGSELFDAICESDEYYVTRADLAATRAHVADIAKELGPRCRVVEYGSGSGLKTRLLLDELEAPVAYVPIEISPVALDESVQALREEFPDIEVLPVCADYTSPVEVPSPRRAARATVVYFPGSTIGNFHRKEATAFLVRMRRLAGEGGAVLIGVDLKKDAHVLERAYNDRLGITAAFNKNLLTHVNRVVGSDFDEARFEHRAVYDETMGRIEMHLVSRGDQEVHIPVDRARDDVEVVSLRRGETIRTEVSYKYSLREFAELASEAMLQVTRVWTDPAGRFSLQLLRPIMAGA